jgi:hypothetical protein
VSDSCGGSRRVASLHPVADKSPLNVRYNLTDQLAYSRCMGRVNWHTAGDQGVSDGVTAYMSLGVGSLFCYITSKVIVCVSV